MSSHILVVEDEHKIAQLLQDYLHHEGMTSTHLSRGDAVEPWLAQQHADLILLDVMLPAVSGLELCKRIRQNANIPIMLVTARTEEIDRLLGLELGADDYICKPFSPREVVARVKTVLRRCQQPALNTTHLSPLKLDRASYQAWLHGHNLELTAVEFLLLATLVEHPTRIFNREQLMNLIYQDHRVVADRTIDSHIKKIRRKISQILPNQELIHSLYGVGYKYEWTGL
ncbi:two-component system response regulator BaeR [Agitococcus lubricus]|uniref:Two-component system response regulator BaeR n=2 Tax=Agitococcus lubricus TaxID=1077255 RepID=A0A2T5J466_9GAMM|nr:two-component system response regulator BaeR [Agitococcus lubricus]